MLDRLADTFVAGVELLEAEGRIVRDRAAAIIGGAVLAIAFSALALLGAITLATGITWLVARAVGVPEALCIVGGVLAGAAGLGAHETIHRLKP